MHILRLEVIDQYAAVHVAHAELNAVAPKKLLKNVMSDSAEVAGEDRVVVIECASGVLKVRAQRVISRGSHRSAHVVCVGYASINYPARRHAAYAWAVSAF